jgi:uncharacterized protein YcbK (DUF882 family)
MEDGDRMTDAPGLLSRRRFLGLGAAALSLPFLSRLSAFASPEPFLPPNRDLSFFNTHTGESAAVEYCHSGCLITPSLDKINHILRDDRTGDTKAIDVRLLDLLSALSRKISTDEPFHVISGYRSPSTNAFLRAHGGGVAANSLHLLGQAIDIRIPGLPLRDLYRAAVALRGGGVGIYPGSDFVHVDVGRVRTW